MDFLLCADLHLKESEKQYSFPVLHEIIDLCAEKKCEALLFAGDIFDDWGEAKNLYADFRNALKKLPDSCKVYYLPGNHEELRASSISEMKALDFGSNVQLLHEKPFSFIENFSKDAELIAIPFQKDYSEYRNWKVPAKKKTVRILLAHGTVNGVTYTGPGEVKESVFDDHIFSFLQIDFAAMGHIHSPKTIKKGNTVAAYPGSARVCREGEEGKCFVILGNIPTLQPNSVPLITAGEFRVVSVFASPNGELSSDLSEIDVQPNDWIKLDVNGVVEDETVLVSSLEKYITELKKKCRQVTENRDNLSVVSGILTHPLAKSFLDAWEKKACEYTNTNDAEVYKNARLQGLIAIKNIMEKKK